MVCRAYKAMYVPNVAQVAGAHASACQVRSIPFSVRCTIPPLTQAIVRMRIQPLLHLSCPQYESVRVIQDNDILHNHLAIIVDCRRG